MDVAKEREIPSNLKADKRILLVFPVFFHVLPLAFENFLRMTNFATRTLPGYAFDYTVRERELIHGAMNAATEAFLSSDEHVAMIAFDDDCLPPYWAIRRLVRHFEHGHHVVGGVGVMRGFPHTTTVGRFFPEKRPVLMPRQNGQLEFRGFEWLDNIDDEPRLPESGLVEVDFTGFPITLFSKAVMKAVEKPCFQHSDGKGGHCTHDVYFCQQAQNAGFKIYVDPDVRCGHIVAPPVVTLENRGLARAMTTTAQQAVAAPVEETHGAHAG